MLFSAKSMRYFRSAAITSGFQFSCTMSTNERVKRSSNYSKLHPGDLEVFRKALGDSNVKTTGIDAYNVDMMKWNAGKSDCVLFPENEIQLSQVLKHCYHRNLAIVPQSGNTGLVGGGLALFDEIILSMKKFNKNYKLDTFSGVLQCDAGWVLQELDERLGREGFMMPIDLGAKGSCLIGGNVSTNAGGIRLIRYGSLQANVLGMRVALADENGSIITLGSNLRKDNSDLHLRNLFIGSEGQLGIITNVSILVADRPTNVRSIFLGTDKFEKCCELLKLSRKTFGETLSGFEFLDAEAMHSVEDNTDIRNVLSTRCEFYVLIEASSSSQSIDSEMVQGFLDTCMKADLIEDGILLIQTIFKIFCHFSASKKSDSDYFWRLRETVPLASFAEGYVFKHDFSLPQNYFYALTEAVRQRLADTGVAAKRVVAFGHLGDGNLHLNVISPAYDERIENLLYPFVYDWVVEHGGSISAEHGIGRLKRSFHRRKCSAKNLELNRAIKNVFDPRQLLSPYKMID